MKNLKAYKHFLPLTNLPIWIDIQNHVLNLQDFQTHDIIYCDYGYETIEVISNKHGPIGFMYRAQFAEFMLDDTDIIEFNEAGGDFEEIDRVLANIN
jgi:hypothetical protein